MKELLDRDFLSLPQLSFEEKKEIYFSRTGHTAASLAKIACCSQNLMAKYLREKDMPEVRHEALVRGGIPAEILPPPRPYRLGVQPPKPESAEPQPQA